MESLTSLSSAGGCWQILLITIFPSFWNYHGTLHLLRESLCIEKQEVKLQSTQGIRCRVCWANCSAFSACQVRWPGLFPCGCSMCCCPLGKVLHTLSPSCLLCPLYFVKSCLLLKSLGLSEVFIYKQMQKCLSLFTGCIDLCVDLLVCVFAGWYFFVVVNNLLPLLVTVQ